MALPHVFAQTIPTSEKFLEVLRHVWYCTYPPTEQKGSDKGSTGVRLARMAKRSLSRSLQDFAACNQEKQTTQLKKALITTRNTLPHYDFIYHEEKSLHNPRLLYGLFCSNETECVGHWKTPVCVVVMGGLLN